MRSLPAATEKPRTARIPKAGDLNLILKVWSRIPEG